MSELAKPARPRPRHPSLRKAIDEMCKSCIVDPTARGVGKWREQIEACTARECPLFKVRPKVRRDKRKSRRERFAGDAPEAT